MEGRLNLIMGAAKDEILQMELRLIFKKDPMFPDNPETFTVSCSGIPPEAASEILTDEN